MDSLTSLHDFLTNATSILNFVLSVELAVACLWGVRHGFWLGEASAGKIALLATITAIMFRLWQSWPYEWVWFAAWPQCAFVVFAGGLAGCTLKWGVDRSFLRS